MMRFRLLPLAALLMAGTAFAKGDKKKDAEPDKKGGMMEESGKDPAATETLDEDGQFVPGRHKKTTRKTGDESGEGGEAGAAAEGEEGGKGGEEEKKPEEPKKPRTVRKTIGVFAEALIGFGEAPVPGPNNPTTGSATSYAFLLGGHYDVLKEFRVMLRVPWTTASISVDGRDKNSAALGNPEILGRLRLTPPGDSEFALRLGIGIPVGQGNPDPKNVEDAAGREQNVVQAMANAASGWHDPELYSPKRMAITPAVLYTLRADKFRFSGEAKVALMPKTGGSLSQPTEPGGGKYELKSLAVIPVVGGTASYEVFEQKHLALSAWALYPIVEPIEYSSNATQPSRFQFVLEPKILAQFGRVVPSIGFLIPVGGQLGGNVNGLRIHVDVIF